MNTFWPRFITKDYLFAKFYKKNTFFFQNVWTFLIKIPVVNKYHQNKVLSVSKKSKKFICIQCCMTAQLSFKV
ncbi:unnamed protein product [Staurois parvus]|uniref:Uncharacterized protein n=1 Tax=Staurois parvus TaxID=386267 RepID=A0ABN9BLY4_9NEOB|nr:unnamed protein product [Staurois parvus]